jgi:hypothetical protein
MMTLEELKKFLNDLPKEFNSFGVVNGEVGTLSEPDEKGEEQYVYRIDKPIITLFVDEETKEICFFHQTQDDVNVAYGRDDIEELKD